MVHFEIRNKYWRLLHGCPTNYDVYSIFLNARITLHIFTLDKIELNKLVARKRKVTITRSYTEIASLNCVSFLHIVVVLRPYAQNYRIAERLQFEVPLLKWNMLLMFVYGVSIASPRYFSFCVHFFFKYDGQWLEHTMFSYTWSHWLLQSCLKANCRVAADSVALARDKRLSNRYCSESFTWE